MVATKVTLTLPDELLVAADDFVSDHPGVTRSGVCADALRAWLRAREEEEIERYYLSMSSETAEEESDWRAVAAQGAAEIWR